MFAQVHYPDHLPPIHLDRYLQHGWFRMGQSVFTTNFLHFKQQYYSAIWLRVVLADFVSDHAQERLYKRNRRFRVEFRTATLDLAKEELFALYKQGISFETSPSLYHLLYGKSFHNIFQTMEVNLYDGEILVACGFFDMGEKAAAGITSFYNPLYKKHSLGKYLIYLKMNYCKDLGLDFFYPGYFVPGYSFFNYKLDLGREALEYLDVASDRWFPIAGFSRSPYQHMEEKLLQLQSALEHEGIESRLFNYEFFDANLFPELKDVELLDYPVFLNCFSFHEEIINPIVVFDVRDDEYHLIQCKSLWTSNLPSPAERVYSFHLLAPDGELAITSVASEIIKRLKETGSVSF
jgi:arginine-tRNA-protein transferase